MKRIRDILLLKRFLILICWKEIVKKTLSLLDDEFYSLGTGGDEIAKNKADFTQLLKAELDVLSEPLEYKVKSICGKEIVPNVWDNRR